MLHFLIKRLIIIIPVLIIISIISFIIIQLPPGDYLTTYIIELSEMGDRVSMSEVEYLREYYGLNQPIYIQYFKWVGGILKGDLGYSFEWGKPVSNIIGERIGLTLIVSLFSLLFTWIVAFPIGFFSAIKQYSIWDYIFTFVGFIGLATPNFLLALVLMYIYFEYFGVSVSGLFSTEFIRAPWSMAKFIDMLKHIWIPMIVIGTAGTAGLIRILRNNLLDELQKPYVITARAKGVNELKLLFKYPVRIAINPFISTVGWLLPRIFSGATITAIVLNLPTIGPVLLRALMVQDMYLAGSIVLILASLTVVGTLLSDVLLAMVDPRIRYK